MSLRIALNLFLLSATARVELIRNGFLNTGQIHTIETEFPLEGLRILDIGCGGGILSQV